MFSNMVTDIRTDEKTPVPPLETPASFPFPYAKPYSIQVDLMRVVFEAIENGKIAIVSETRVPQCQHTYR